MVASEGPAEDQTKTENNTEGKSEESPSEPVSVRFERSVHYLYIRYLAEEFGNLSLTTTCGESVVTCYQRGVTHEQLRNAIENVLPKEKDEEEAEGQE